MTTVYKKGDKDPYIAKIQRALNETVKLNLLADGEFGEKTEQALKAWQTANKFPVTGIYKDSTAVALDAYIARRFLKEQDFVDSANVLRTEVACVKAVQEVESRGSGFLNDGRSIILFERHVFKKELDKLLNANLEFAKQVAVKAGLNLLPGQSVVPAVQAHLIRTQPDIYNNITGGYIGGAKEWDRLAKAAILDSGAAHRSASWGLFQIMGYHYSILGFKSVEEMVKSYTAAERNQLMSFCDFVKYDSRLLTAIQEKNWLKFAIIYNGPAQKGYNTKLEAAYAKHSS
jgi:hypothetical protein